MSSLRKRLRAEMARHADALADILESPAPAESAESAGDPPALDAETTPAPRRRRAKQISELDRARARARLAKLGVTLT